MKLSTEVIKNGGKNMQLRKIISGTIGLVMATATLAFPALAAEVPSGFPAPYVENNVADYTVVYGALGAASDVNAADEIASALADQVVSTEEGGELEGGSSLSTTNTPLYLGSGWNEAFDTVTDSHLPSVLADGTAISSDGTEYDYTQYVMLTNESSGDRGMLSFGKNGDLSDPVLNVEIGTQSSQVPFYSKVTFDKNLNVTSGDRGLAGEEIELFGKNFVVSSDSTAGTDLVLFGASNMMSMKSKEEKTITVSGEDYLVKIVSVVDSDTATVSVDGTSKDIDEGNTKKIGGLEVYVDTVNYYQDIIEGVAIDSGDVDLVFGSEKLTFQNGKTVKYGSSGDTLEGTNCYLNWDSNNDLSELYVNASAADSDEDFLSPGNCFQDRVWETFEFCMGNTDPALTADDRDKITLKAVSADTVELEFTTADDKEVSLEIANIVDVNDGNPKLQDSNDRRIHVREWNNSDALFKGGPMSYGEKEYFITNENSYSHMFQITDISSVGSTGGEINLKDVLTGDSYTVSLKSSNYSNGTLVIDGNKFYFQVNGSPPGSSCTPNCGVNVTWGSGANYDDAGDAVSLFPSIETSNGGWLSLINNVTVGNTTYELPKTGQTDEYGTTTVDTSSANGGLATNFWYAPNHATNPYVTAGANVTMAGEGPGIFLLEEKDEGEVKNALMAFVGYDSTNKRITVEESLFNMTQYTGGDLARKSVTSDNYVDKWVNRYGTYAIVTDSQDGGGMIEIYYPDEQAEWDLRIGEVGEIATGGGVATATAIMDTDVTDADRNTSNIIVVGGPCVNTLAAELLDVEFPACGADSGWEEGDQVIDEYVGQFSSGNTALLVAGWAAEDTTAVADMLAEALA